MNTVGTHCETEIDECSSDPCANDATCTDLLDMYECTCIDGYTGNESVFSNIDEENEDKISNIECKITKRRIWLYIELNGLIFWGLCPRKVLQFWGLGTRKILLSAKQY